MNIILLCYLLKYRRPVQKGNGFTLIELLAVVIVIGVLAAISIPNLLGQIGKAREVEGKNSMGTIARSQQAYHFETQTFADTLDILDLNITSLPNEYYSYPDPATANNNVVLHQATAKDAVNDQNRNYAVGVYHSAGLFSTVLCQSRAPGATVAAPASSGGSCSNGGTTIK